MLLELVEKNGGAMSLAIKRKLRRHSFIECCSILRRLEQHKKLGKIETYIENGITIKKCPPAWAGGIYPQRNIIQRS